MFFKNLLNKMKNRKPMMANRMGGFLRNRPQLMERIRNAKSMRGMGRGMMNPNMQVGIMGLNPMMARSMKARMMGLPDPRDFDANNLPFPQPGQRSDIMPRDPGFGFNMPKRPPIMPGVLPQPSGPDGPIRSVIEPVEGTIQPPKYYNQDEYMPKAPIIGMAEGGEFPNAGLAALAKERPDVVKKILGKQAGGEISLFEIYSRLQKSMGQLSKDEMDLLKDMYSDGKFSAGDMMQKVKDFRDGKFMPRKFEDLETKRNRLSRTMGTGETAQRAKAIGRSTPNQAKVLANAIAKIYPIRTTLAAGRGMLGRLAGPVTAGLGALSFMDYYNKLKNPEPETITLTQEEFDEMRRQAQRPEVLPVTLRDMD